MFKKNKIISAFVFVSFLLMLFSSCKDNPVTTNTPYQFDTARFNWKVDTLQGNIYEIWGNDTNAIYFRAPYGMLKYDGKNYNIIMFPAGLFSRSFDGYDERNLYIGGFDMNYNTPRLVKYDGSVFTDIPLNMLLNDTDDCIYKIYAYNNNEIWFGTAKGKFMKYDGNIVSYFNYDTNFEIFPLLKTSNGDFYVYVDNIFQVLYSGNLVSKIFNFKNNTWDVIYSKTNDSITPKKFNDDLIGLGSKNFSAGTSSIYKFESDSYVKILSTPFIVFYAMDGNSEEDFIIGGEIKNSTNSSIFHWNGNKWGLERNFYNWFYFNDIKKIQSKYIVLLNNINITKAIVCYGTKK